MKLKTVSEKPFFARLLEVQKLDEVQTDLKAGKIERTLKYPSDGDDWPGL